MEKCGTARELLACLFCQVKLPSSITAKQYINHIQVDLRPILLARYLVSQVQHNIRTYSEVSRALSHLNESRQANPRLEKICLKSPASVKTPPSVRKTVHMHTVVDGKSTSKPGYHCICYSRRLFPNRSCLSEVT